MPVKSAGINTGPFPSPRSDGYKKLTDEVREILDINFREIEDLISTNPGRYTKVKYSSDGAGGLGTNIFSPSVDVKNYIISKINDLGNITYPEPQVSENSNLPPLPAPDDPYNTKPTAPKQTDSIPGDNDNDNQPPVGEPIPGKPAPNGGPVPAVPAVPARDGDSVPVAEPVQGPKVEPVPGSEVEPNTSSEEGKEIDQDDETNEDDEININASIDSNKNFVTIKVAIPANNNYTISGDPPEIKNIMESATLKIANSPAVEEEEEIGSNEEGEEAVGEVGADDEEEIDVGEVGDEDNDEEEEEETEEEEEDEEEAKPAADTRVEEDATTEEPAADVAEEDGDQADAKEGSANEVGDKEVEEDNVNRKRGMEQDKKGAKKKKVQEDDNQGLTDNKSLPYETGAEKRKTKKALKQIEDLEKDLASQKKPSLGTLEGPQNTTRNQQRRGAIISYKKPNSKKERGKARKTRKIINYNKEIADGVTADGATADGATADEAEKETQTRIKAL